MYDNFRKGIYPKWQIYTAILPAVFLFMIFVVFPAVANLFFSFTDYRSLSVEKTNWIWFQNYITVFTRGNNLSDIGLALKNTAVIAFTVTIAQNILAVLLAVLVNSRIEYKNFYRAVIFLPITLGPVIQGLVWTLAFAPYQGTISGVLSKIGINSTYFGDEKIAIYMVIMVIMWANVGFAMAIYLAGLQSLPQELYEAGYIDGATGLSAFRHITLPLLSQAVTVNMTICLIGSINIVDIIMVTTNGGPGRATMNLPFYIIDAILYHPQNYTQGYISAVTILQFIITFVVVVTAQYFLRRREVEL